MGQWLNNCSCCPLERCTTTLPLACASMLRWAQLEIAVTKMGVWVRESGSSGWRTDSKALELRSAQTCLGGATLLMGPCGVHDKTRRVGDAGQSAVRGAAPSPC